MGLMVLIFIVVIVCLTVWGCLRIRKKFNRGWKFRDYLDRYGEDFREERRKFKNENRRESS